MWVPVTLPRAQELVSEKTWERKMYQLLGLTLGSSLVNIHNFTEHQHQTRSFCDHDVVRQKQDHMQATKMTR
jgi:hypothetical protein